MILKGDALAALLTDTDSEDPFDIIPRPNLDELRRSGSASIDLRLGTWFVALRQSKASILDVMEMQSSNIGEGRLTRRHYVPFGDKYILHPHNFVLGVTLEWIRLSNNVACYVVGKSSWGRRGLIIATAAGVHPGFAGCLTLELSNVGEIPVAIAPGLPICQLFVHKCESKGSEVDQSSFVGHRRPTLGAIHLDEIAKRLAKS